jgi:TatD DNase family protein
MKIGPIDSHAHLGHPHFDPDRPEVISRARENGLQAILTLGTEPEEFPKEIRIARDYPGWIYLGMGYHPHIAKDITDTHYEMLRELLISNKEVLALGEIGLDFYYKHSDPESQEGVFREQLRLASRLSLPVVIHCRDAYPQMIRILKSEPVSPEKALIHCFSGNTEQAESLLSWGACLSFAGPVTFPKTEGLSRVVQMTPLDRIMAETDAPYLSPQRFRGKRNEPLYVTEVYNEISGIKDVPIEVLIEKISLNFSRFFGISIE